jgi:hypothetical protein
LDAAIQDGAVAGGTISVGHLHRGLSREFGVDADYHF